MKLCKCKNDHAYIPGAKISMHDHAYIPGVRKKSKGITRRKGDSGSTPDARVMGWVIRETTVWRLPPLKPPNGNV